MKRFLSKNKKVFGYVAYAFLLLIALLYYRFPSDVFSDYVQEKVNQAYPEIVLSIEKVSPFFPIRLKFQGLEISEWEAPKRSFLSADSLILGPKILPLFKGERKYNFYTSLYEGEINGYIQYNSKPEEKPMGAELEINDIHIEKYPYLSDIIGRQIEGVLEGAIIFQGSGDSLLRGSGEANLKLSNGLLYLQTPIIGLDSIDFDQIILEMDLKNQRITFSRAEIKSTRMQGSASGTISLRNDFHKSRIDLQVTVEPYAELLNDLGSSIDTVKSLLKTARSLSLLRERSAILESILYRTMTKIFYPIFNLIALTAIVYFGVDIFYRSIEEQLNQVSSHKVEVQRTPDTGSKKRTSLKDFNAITDRNIFGSAEKVSEETQKTEIETLEPTTLKVALLGTITDSQQSSVAIIEDKTKKKQDLYRVGDSVQDAVIKMIVRGKVVLRVGDKDEVLTMVESSSSSTPERPASRASQQRTIARTITLRQEDIEKSFENMSELLSQARVQPNLKDGVADGFRITGIKSGSIFRRMGLRNGDIIRTVNGSTISSMDEAMTIYNDMKSGGNGVSLEIERRGQLRTLNYKIR